MNCMGHGVIKMHSATSDIATLLGLQNVLGITMTVTILSPNLSSGEVNTLSHYISYYFILYALCHRTIITGKVYFQISP